MEFDLLNILVSDREEYTQKLAALALGEFAGTPLNQESIQLLGVIAVQGQEYARLNALRALSKFKDPSAELLILRTAKNLNETFLVRGGALIELANSIKNHNEW